MSFQTKDFFSIVAGAVNQMRAAVSRITDFRIGSAARTLIEGPAVEIDELYQQMTNGLVDAIPAALYLSFGFDSLPAIQATGVITFYRTSPSGSDATVAAGTQVSTPDGLKTYTTLSTVTLPLGQLQVSVGVRATAAGVAFNAGIGDVTVLAPAPAGVFATNLSPINSGRDNESEDERAVRFREFIASLSRGPLGSLEYGARQARLLDAAGLITERVAEARAVEEYQISGTRPLGYVDLYVFNGGSGASATLVARAQQIVDGYVDGSTRIDGYKAAGVVVRVQAAELRVVPLTWSLVLVNDELSSSQRTKLNAEISAAIAAVPIGTTLYTAAIVAAALRVPGVLNARPLNQLNDLVPARNEKLASGVLTYQVQL